jgi:choline kinase
MEGVGTAVILAAGLGLRLRGAWPELPKGLLPVGGETLVGRSLTLLRSHGVHRVVIVAGYRASLYHQLAAGRADVEVVENPAFADAGSMASLDIGLAATAGADTLVLESDLFYEARALAELLTHSGADVVLASGPTGAGDEVWVEAPGGRVSALSKDPSALGTCDGEYVGILRVSPPLGRLLRDLYSRFGAVNGHGRMAYDTDALHAAAPRHPLELCRVDDLLWGEIDDEGHLARVRDRVAPAVLAREAAVVRNASVGAAPESAAREEGTKR